LGSLNDVVSFVRPPRPFILIPYHEIDGFRDDVYPLGGDCGHMLIRRIPTLIRVYHLFERYSVRGILSQIIRGFLAWGPDAGPLLVSSPRPRTSTVHGRKMVFRSASFTVRIQLMCRELYPEIQ
jgi:hypothetical protein